MSKRSWNARVALDSYEELNRVINELTEEEILACLKLEAASQRRRTFIDRLIARASRLASDRVSQQLKAKYAPS